MATDKLRWYQKAALRIAGFNVPALSSINDYNSSLKMWIGNTAVYRNWQERDQIKAFDENGSLYSIVTTITETSSWCPFSIYKIKDQKKAYKAKMWNGEKATDASLQRYLQIKSEAYELVDNHPMSELLVKPNEYQTWTEFIETSIGFKLLTGERFLLITQLDIGANAGKITSMINLPPQHMAVHPGTSFSDPIGGYELLLNTPVPISIDRVIFSRKANYTYDGNGSHLRGRSPLRSQYKNLDRMEAGMDRGVAMLQNAGAAGILFNKATEGMTEDQARDLKRVANVSVNGANNAGTIGVGNGDLGYHNFGISAHDMDLLPLERLGTEALAIAYKVPPGKFMASANATDNNIAAWNKQTISGAVIPALSDFREDLNKVLKRFPNSEEYYIDYDPTIYPEMQEDYNTLATRLAKSHYMTLNEMRIAMGMDEDTENEMMKKYFIPSNWKLIDDLDPNKLDDELDLVDREIEEEEIRSNGKLNGQAVKP